MPSLLPERPSADPFKLRLLRAMDDPDVREKIRQVLREPSEAAHPARSAQAKTLQMLFLAPSSTASRTPAQALPAGRPPQTAQHDARTESKPNFSAEKAKLLLELQNLRQENEKFLTDFQALQEENSKLLVDTQAIRAENAQLQRDTQAIQAENAKLQLDVQDFQQENIKLQLEIQELQPANSKLVANVQELRQENSDLLKRLQSQSDEHAQWSRQVTSLEQEKEDLQTQIQVQSSERMELLERVHYIQTEREKLQQTLSDDRTHHTEELRRLCAALGMANTRLSAAEQIVEPFQPLLGAFEDYRAMPIGFREDLQSVLPDQNPISFLAAGSQINHLLVFWDCMKAWKEQNPQTVTDRFLRVLSYFLEQINALWSAPVYRLMERETGQPFDNRKHTRSMDCSRYQGEIQEVLLPGIWNVNKDCAERKCLVRF